MPVPYNLTGMNETTNFISKVVILNDAVNMMLAIGILLVVGFTLFIIMERYGASNSLGTTSFILILLGLFMFVAGLINGYILGFLIFIMIAGILTLYLKGGD